MRHLSLLLAALVVISGSLFSQTASPRLGSGQLYLDPAGNFEFYLNEDFFEFNTTDLDEIIAGLEASGNLSISPELLSQTLQLLASAEIPVFMHTDLETNLNILSQPIDGYLSPEILLASAPLFIQQLEREIPGLVPTNRGELVEGVNTKLFFLAYRHDITGSMLQVAQYYVVVNQNLVVLTATTPLKRAKTMMPLFTEMARTFRIH